MVVSSIPVSNACSQIWLPSMSAEWHSQRGGKLFSHLGLCVLAYMQKKGRREALAQKLQGSM